MGDFLAKGRLGYSKPWESGKFTAEDNFPDFSNHDNVLSSNLTLEVSVTVFSQVSRSADIFLLECNE